MCYVFYVVYYEGTKYECESKYEYVVQCYVVIAVDGEGLSKCGAQAED